MEKKYLTEENYEKGKKKIKTLALIVLIVGLLIGGNFIGVGIKKQKDVNNNYSDSNKQTIKEQLATEKENLNNKKLELENKIKPIQDEIKSLEREEFTGFDDAYYKREDKIKELEKSIQSDGNSINAIEEALDETFNYCAFDKAKNNSYTAKYCSLKNQLDIKTEFNKNFDSFDSIPFYMIGGFIIIVSCMFAGSMFVFSKRREITAFTAQQVMPVAKEGIDEMAPTVGNAVGEIAKGIKKGLKDNEEK